MALTFSVITPSFNQLEWLKLCAASVADQQGVTFEHLVQDAGTGSELEAWAATCPTIQLTVESDDGMYDAVNRGLRRAQGDICSYLNCDEQYLPGTLQRVGRFFEQHPHIDVVFGDAILIDTDGQPFSYRRIIAPQMPHTLLVHLATLTCATFFRRHVFEQGHQFDTRFKVIGDRVWVYGMLQANVPLAVMRQPLSAFMLTGANLSETPAATEEAEAWIAEHRTAWRPWQVVMHHRLRRLLGGAYLPRRPTIELYTPQSGTSRKRWPPRWLSSRWTSPARDRAAPA